MTGYPLAHSTWDKEPQRLAALARWGEPLTTELLTRLGLSGGWRCLEVGAGDGSIARWLAEQVGPDGDVLAVDLETELLARDPRPNLRARRADVCADDLPEATFDLVHCRSVLAHLSDPDTALRRMVAALAPGGWLLLGASDLCWSELPRWPTHPPTAADTVTRVMRAVIAHTGSWHGSMLGRELIERVYAQPLLDVGGEARVPLADRNGSEWMRLTVERFQPELVAAGLISEADLAAFHTALADPGAWMAGPLYFYAWGRAPG